MPLTEYDVLKTLSDPILKKIDFFVDDMHISGEAYQKIYDLIKDEQIIVTAGKDPNSAHYDPKADTIATQDVLSPPNLFNRSILVHECTHAIKDMEFVTITALGNEAAAYLAQATYLALSTSKPQIPPGWGVVEVALKLVRKFHLDTLPGKRTHLHYDDILELVRRINNHPAYRQDQARLSVADGISKKLRKHIPLPGSPEPTSAKVRYSAMMAYKVPSDALFAVDKHDIRPAAEPALHEAADYIKEFMGPGSRAYITGHTDSTGNAAHNKILSKRRADAVAQWLIRNKFVDANRLSTGGEGESKPIAPNTDENGRARNRRVEILIM